VEAVTELQEKVEELSQSQEALKDKVDNLDAENK
jgi:hypothetical protein